MKWEIDVNTKTIFRYSLPSTENCALCVMYIINFWYWQWISEHSLCRIWRDKGKCKMAHIWHSSVYKSWLILRFQFWLYFCCRLIFKFQFSPYLCCRYAFFSVSINNTISSRCYKRSTSTLQRQCKYMYPILYFFFFNMKLVYVCRICKN